MAITGAGVVGSTGTTVTVGNSGRTGGAVAVI